MVTQQKQESSSSSSRMVKQESASSVQQQESKSVQQESALASSSSLMERAANLAQTSPLVRRRTVSRDRLRDGSEDGRRTSVSKTALASMEEAAAGRTRSMERRSSTFTSKAA